jgi:hypothetical protein
LPNIQEAELPIEPLEDRCDDGTSPCLAILNSASRRSPIYAARTRKFHKLSDIVFLVLAAVISGIEDWVVVKA